MRNIKYLFIVVFSLLITSYVQGQEEEEVVAKPIRPMFGSAYIMDNQSVQVNPKNTLEAMIQHRFGTIENGISDFFGVYGISNIRLGITYSPIKNLSVGYGITQNKMHQDFNWKYAILTQTRSGSTPLSVSYYGNAAIDSRAKEDFRYYASATDRVSFFHQVILARKFSSKLSFQVSPSFTHYNAVPAFEDSGDVVALRNNDHLALSLSGRYKVSAQGSIIVDFNQPLTDHFADDPESNFSFGYEIVTSSHAFQVFLGNYWGIVPQENNFNNQNSEFLIGFNITRLWSF